jgi:hypothetical protein
LYACDYGPGLLFHKTYDTEPYLGSMFVNYTAGSTSKSYDKHGQVVPFLQEYGSDDLLHRFIDPMLSQTNTETIGQIKFTGNLDFERLYLFYCKNIHRNCFIAIGTMIQNMQINAMESIVKVDTTLNFTEEQQLAVFSSKFSKNLNTSGMLTTAIEFGYNRIFEDLESINFLQLFLSGSIATPQVMHGHNLAILQYPLAGNISFGYPLTAILACGINKHLNVGVFGMIIPFQPRQINGHVNHKGSHNNILLDHETALTVYPKPVLSSVFYIEAHSFIKNFMATFGYGSSWGMPWKIKARDEKKYPEDVINDNELLNGWNICSMFAQVDYNLQSEKHPYAPTLSLFYVFPISGRYFPKINIIGGMFTLGIHYDF